MAAVRYPELYLKADLTFSLACIGRFAIQIAAIYRFRVIATCGRKSFDHVRSLGAHHVINYHDNDVIAQIRALAPNLEYAFDAVGSSSSLATVSEALSGSGGNLCSIQPNTIGASMLAPNVNATEVRLWRAFLQGHRFDGISSPVSLLLEKYLLGNMIAYSARL